LLDIKALYESETEKKNDQYGDPYFSIAENINFGILLDPKMSLHLDALDNSIAYCSGMGNDAACGIVIGRQTNSENDWTYGEKL
jgi:hypothetical protein